MVSRARQVVATLSHQSTHDAWAASHLTSENDEFSSLAFDFVARSFRTTGDPVVLDVGCGKGVQSVRLAKLGFHVWGVDCGQTILREAREVLSASEVGHVVTLQQADLCELPLRTASVTNILCWGVLMHVPEVERALDELARICKPNGVLVIGENNMKSAQSMASALFRWIVRPHRPGETRENKATGHEIWMTTPVGLFLEREANISWLIEHMMTKGFSVEKRVARQFTESYVKLSSRRARRTIHIGNNLWFKYVKSPHLAFGNILVLRKSTEGH